jgi:HEAT repeat protein
MQPQFPLRGVMAVALALGPGAAAADAQHLSRPILPIVLPEDELLQRASALRRLAESGTLEALGEALGALDDPAPLVADTVQLACAVIDTPEAAKLLLGKLGLQHVDDSVRLRAAEAIGRTGATYRADLFRTLLPRADTAECRALLASIEQLALRRQLTGDLDETAQWIQTWIRGKHDDEMRATALATVSAMSPERGARYTASILRQKPPPMLAASALGRCLDFRLPGALTELQAGLVSPNPTIRAATIRVFDSQADRETVTWLVDCLEREVRLGLRWRAVEALQNVTGLRFELDAPAWRGAVNALALDWTSAEARVAVPRGRESSLSLEELAALEPRSDRWVLVTHFAPRIVEEAVLQPTTRSERILAQRQRATPTPTVTDGDLRSALAALSSRLASDVQSDIVVAGTRVARLGRALAPHTPARVEQARTFLDEESSSAAGDLYGALMAALDTEGVDRILLVTRGGACTGQHVDLELIVGLLLRHDRFRHVAIDVVFVDVVLQPLRRLAAESRGRVLQIELAGRRSR